MKLNHISISALLIVGLFLGVLAAGTLTNSETSPPAASTTRGPIQNIRFTVYDAGIYPRQLRAKPGVIAIVVEDRTRRRPGLVITRENVGGSLSVGGISIPLGQSRARTEFRLGVGRYRVSDTTNPANQAELIVEP
jgi:hypothetical protein